VRRVKSAMSAIKRNLRSIILELTALRLRRRISLVYLNAIEQCRWQDLLAGGPRVSYLREYVTSIDPGLNTDWISPELFDHSPGALEP
jgi:hypothetical protein